MWTRRRTMNDNGHRNGGTFTTTTTTTTIDPYNNNNNNNNNDHDMEHNNNNNINNNNNNRYTDHHDHDDDDDDEHDVASPTSPVSCYYMHRLDGAPSSKTDHRAAGGAAATPFLPQQQPPSSSSSTTAAASNNNTLLHRSSINGSRRTTLLDDCESGISMNCRCRKATLLIVTFFVAILVAFYSNISLVIKLGAATTNNNSAYDHLFHHHHNHPETFLHLQQMMQSPNAVVVESSSSNSNNKKNNIKKNNKKKNRVDTKIIGDDDDPLQESDDTAADATTNGSRHQQPGVTDDGTALDSVADLQALSNQLRNKKKNMKKKKPKKTPPRDSRNENQSKQQKKKSTGSELQPVKRGNAKANIQDIVPTPEAMSVNASFSACLLIKDDNEILSEWIAYHYHTIKLRHLIVAVDPLSSESPTIILARWKLLTDLQIRLWHDEHYMPDDFLETGQAPPNFIATETDLKNSKMRPESILEISNHRYRQRVFLSSCLRSMRAEGNSWVIHIDSDEYVVPSKLLRQMKPRYVVIPPIEQPGSVLSLIQQVVEKTARNVNYPCISMLRVLFGSVESSLEEQNVEVPAAYNATTFESLRWRYHALPHHAELHGNPKVILDVQAIPAKYFDETIVFSIHRPVREYCPKNSDLAFSNFRKQPIAVNHYLGSWERYSGRNDKRRSRDKYDLKATVNRGHDDGLRTWLRGFVDTMGPVNATKLLGTQYLASATTGGEPTPISNDEVTHE